MSCGKYEQFGRYLDRCESPIERLFLVGVLYLNDTTFEPFGHGHTIARDSMGIELGQQIPVDGFFLDFSLTRPGASRRYAIELDGFVHHGSTPEQFAKDSARQRAITARGWTFLRFSGREVTQNPKKCGAESLREISLEAMSLEPLPVVSAPMKAQIPRPVDPELLRLQSILDEAERSGDWNEQMRIAGEFQNRLRGLLGAA